MHIGAQFKDPKITGRDYDLLSINDHPKYEDLFPNHRPANGSPSLAAWLDAPKASQPWTPLGISKPKK
ncbi:uncharacterized protein N7458_001416 [Penicillium daleae]|uniref:Uncharacterized protein n=1 Tax=Penicillium daleae TaxID=63821 RepID=A0AAD6G4X0_9EURO|nr:uncharacterized protein N7458_001416 [Penicillium daleae]KAJ5459864.1 hypothetical protein N7458_001416 [Penicillium daleae]